MIKISDYFDSIKKYACSFQDSFIPEPIVISSEEVDIVYNFVKEAAKSTGSMKDFYRECGLHLNQFKRDLKSSPGMLKDKTAIKKTINLLTLHKYLEERFG